MNPDTVSLIPKVDLHVHQESSPRLDRVLSRSTPREPFDWQSWSADMIARTPPGIERLRELASVHPVPQELDQDPELFIARHVDLFSEAASDGAVLVEVRCGRKSVRRPDFIPLFREAERRVRMHHPHFHAEPVMMFKLWYGEHETESLMSECLRLAGGVAGIDFVYEPYDREADWSLAYRVADRLSSEGFGITAHVGEFSTANIRSALKMPGLSRIGHGLQAAESPELLNLIGESGILVECCLTSNVKLGAVRELEDHPIRRMMDLGIRVGLGTDDPVQLCTTIGAEYARAGDLGLGDAELLRVSTDAVQASFLPEDAKARLRTLLEPFEHGLTAEGRKAFESDV
ncbi:adenosine deaminase family protein [Glycomyces buryatensis]|uniref:adenosine deaminase n=1 Tax=Glycomyces buryatensis TaxID=2570927 RepID=A0A4V4HRF4_9ACTN|nr:hypothetical protein [Glycomyces buryatensis]THV37626.1 hypothetical protein FAB82_20325 [Glycomyces buryatensis]